MDNFITYNIMASITFPFKPEEKHLCIERPSKTNPRGLTKEQLMDYARGMGISTAGNKTELCDRIFAHIGRSTAMSVTASVPPPAASVVSVGHKPPKAPKEDPLARLLASMPAVPDKPVGLTPELEELWKTDPAFVKMIMAAPLPPSGVPVMPAKPVIRVVATLTAKQVKQMAVELLGVLSDRDPAADRLIVIIAGKVTKEDSDFVLAESRRRATNPRLVTYAALPKQLKQMGGGKNRG